MDAPQDGAGAQLARVARRVAAAPCARHTFRRHGLFILRRSRGARSDRLQVRGADARLPRVRAVLLEVVPPAQQRPTAREEGTDARPVVLRSRGRSPAAALSLRRYFGELDFTLRRFSEIAGSGQPARAALRRRGRRRPRPRGQVASRARRPVRRAPPTRVRQRRSFPLRVWRRRRSARLRALPQPWFPRKGESPGTMPVTTCISPASDTTWRFAGAR